MNGSKWKTWFQFQMFAVAALAKLFLLKSSAPNSSCQPLEDKSETLCRWGESKSLLFRVTLWPAKPVDYLKQIPSRFLHIFFSQQVKIKHKHESASSNSACPEFLVKLSFTPGTAHLDCLEVFGCKMRSKRKKKSRLKILSLVLYFWVLYFIFWTTNFEQNPWISLFLHQI